MIRCVWHWLQGHRAWGDSLLVEPDDVAALLNHALADPPLTSEELDPNAEWSGPHD